MPCPAFFSQRSDGSAEEREDARHDAQQVVVRVGQLVVRGERPNLDGYFHGAAGGTGAQNIKNFRVEAADVLVRCDRGVGRCPAREDQVGHAA